MCYVIYNAVTDEHYILDDEDVLVCGLFDTETIMYGPASYEKCEAYIKYLRGVSC